MENYADLLFINQVRDLQDQVGTGEKYESFYEGRTNAALVESEIAFIAERESFYIASVSSTGWPYVQHRGGPKGFLKVIGSHSLGFADYTGNRQFITMGHAQNDNRVALFLMDYENRARCKLLGRLTMQPVEDADPALVAQLAVPGQGKVERVATIEIVATDWNCPKYIPQLIGVEKAQQLVKAQMQALSEENARLRQEIARLKA